MAATARRSQCARVAGDARHAAGIRVHLGWYDPHRVVRRWPVRDRRRDGCGVSDSIRSARPPRHCRAAAYAAGDCGWSGCGAHHSKSAAGTRRPPDIQCADARLRHRSERRLTTSCVARGTSTGILARVFARWSLDCLRDVDIGRRPAVEGARRRQRAADATHHRLGILRRTVVEFKWREHRDAACAGGIGTPAVAADSIRCRVGQCFREWRRGQAYRGGWWPASSALCAGRRTRLRVVVGWACIDAT